jgi:RNA polymerase sigma factor, sigma-70 family
MGKVITRKPSKADLKFLEDISPEELLSVEQEVKLVKQIQQAEGDIEEAKEKLVHANQRFVRSIAKIYVSPNCTLDELMAEGSKGVVVAIPGFDETRGFKFISYATWWIRQYIQQYIIKKEGLNLNYGLSLSN